MQPQSETSKSKHKAKSSSNQQSQPQREEGHQQPQQRSTHSSATPAPAGRAIEDVPQPQSQLPRRGPIKVIKCKKPLCHFKFYLDIRDHQLTKKIEEQIKALGGALEFFLTSSVTHFITDKTVLQANRGKSNNNNNTLNSRPGTPQTPTTPNTPQTPYSFESNDGKNNGSNTPSGNKRTRQSRADAILNRVRRQSATTSNAATTANNESATNLKLSIDSVRSDSAQPYIIWQTEYALHFFKKVQHELKEYLSARDRKLTIKGCTVEPISLKGGFIKIEAIKHNYRPYYQLFRKSSGTEWPKIELLREDGAFRLSPKKTHQQELEAAAGEQEKKKMTRKSRSRSSQHQRPLPAAVQSLKKGETGAKTGSGHRNSNIGGGVGCKQAKESSDKQCGVCEICKIEYDTLTIHLKTKDHEYFARNSQNFIALDSLIHASADVNKFLGDNKKMEIKSELEEMEVEEDVTADVNARDPLEGPEPLITRSEEKRRSSGAHKTPSPTLREKSKRSTKGKHSSEKFQNATKLSTSKSPKTQPKCSSPQKKPSSSMLELQRIETIASKAVPITTPATRRKSSTTTAAISPPIRAMLPPSSLYKVVETPDACSPVRKARDTGEQAVASPSLIVKFKKVRTTELHRLNGEAESFMFPKQRASSELPTDMDRQTTSDNVRVSVSPTSMDSSSEHMDIEIETTPQPSKQTKSATIESRAIAKGKRRKGRPAAINKQSFPNAPIQPEVQLKGLRKSSTASAAATIVAASTTITLPEATRKSSRTATAIVTAATTSSRLLRAAVEAAKNNHRRIAACGATRRSSPASAPTVKCETVVKPLATVASSPMQMRSRVPVVKMEDRMGDDESNTDESDNDEDEDNDDDSQDNDEEDEESDDEHDDDDGDDDNDKDYVNRKVDCYKRGQPCTTNAVSKYTKRSSARNQRAAQRELRKWKIKEEYVDESEEEKQKYKTRKLPALKIGNTKVKQDKQCSMVSSKKVETQRFFNYADSESLNKMKYAFERLPSSDLWYRVFWRQDACEERYFEYYGSTNYRKLPYELGPIPLDRTLEGIRCKLCNKNAGEEVKTEARVGENCRIKQDNQHSDKSKAKEANANSSTGNFVSAGAPSHSTTPSASEYIHKHKKLHLLQRYQQEQQALMQQKKHSSTIKEEQQEEKPSKTTASSSVPSKCDSKASSPERERERERAGSTHSNTSSCASSTATLSKQKYRNKHLSKAVFLNMELPPRKSPREHASTLALVSCIIKQRQDSQSKPNSETDEPPPSTPTPTQQVPARARASAATQQSVSTDSPAMRSPRHTRSTAVTPVEELRFTTEISENVKRMRRGQNKYDHSPPIVLNSTRPPRGRQPKSPLGRRSYLQKHRSQTPNVLTMKRRKRQKCVISSLPAKHHSYSGLLAQGTVLPSIRKTGSKKGVLEFEVDATALKALEAATKHTDVRQLEWEIDKYLQLEGKEYDVDMDVEMLAVAKDTVTLDGSVSTRKSIANSAATTSSAARKNSTAIRTEDSRSQTFDTNTPPPTDYFSSDFDLYDLFTGAYAGSDDEQVDGNRKGFGLYNSMALQNYFRKRKNLKSNRTGWPKVQKKKSSARQQQMLEQKIRFLRDIGELNRDDVKAESAEGAEMANNEARESGGVITPPDSEIDENEDEKTVVNDDDVDDTELDAGESVPEDDAETMADSVEDDHGVDADADEEDDGDRDAEADGTAEDDDAEEDDFVATRKHTRRSTAASPIEKLVNSMPHSTSAATSTPSTQMLRGLRRTPQLNGSLGSCISPSEKAGDNSDIFTVSSDGLDTDLDISNSHSQQRGDDEHHNHHENCASHTPKRKFDLSRYASNNATSSSCAAEAATAAVKSLAISQFLKKEVRVTCRRLRAPFRRFRYRR